MCSGVSAFLDTKCFTTEAKKVSEVRKMVAAISCNITTRQVLFLTTSIKYYNICYYNAPTTKLCYSIKSREPANKVILRSTSYIKWGHLIIYRGHFCGPNGVCFKEVPLYSYWPAINKTRHQIIILHQTLPILWEKIC